MREMGSRPLKSKLLEQARTLMRVKHRSIRTEAAYLGWMERFLRFHRDRAGQWLHLAEMENSHVAAFLTYLAVEGKVAASTQYQAFFALLFLFREVLKMPLEVNAARAMTPRHVPVGLWVDEVRRSLDPLPAGAVELIAGLLYGAGLRLMEGCRLRVKDIDFLRKQVAISLSRQAAER